MTPPLDHPRIAAPRIGVLLVNLGTPEAPTPAAVKRYLAEFLSDRRVVELPPLLWQPILRGIILNTRPKKSAHAYQSIWADEGSPLEAITRAQALALKDAFGTGVTVDWAMRYGRPALSDKLREMKAAGCERILVAPLYPQYSAATTASVNDAAFAALAAMRWQPALRTLPPWHDEPAYIDALAATTRARLGELDFAPEVIVASFHSMPLATLLKGDPYHCQCQKTARLLSEALGRELVVSFQSKLGRAKWLEPATEATLIDLAKRGVRSAAVITPGFVADNLETLEEIAIRGREVFLEHGGQRFEALPCLNAGHEGVALLKHLVTRELAGWLPAA